MPLDILSNFSKTYKIFQRRIHNQIQAYFECKLSESVDFARAQVHSFGGCDWEMEENGR